MEIRPARAGDFDVMWGMFKTAMYRKLGFEVVGTLPKAFRHRALGLVDVYVMHRFLYLPSRS